MRSSVVTLAIALLAATSSYAQGSFTPIKTFCSEANCTDGSYGNYGNLTQDASGVLYGVTFNGGTTDNGVVFSLTPDAGKTDWTYSVLYNFCSRAHCRDGEIPVGTLVLGTDGSLYGVTEFGGDSGGVIFELTPNAKHTKWKETVIHRFCKQKDCRDGNSPRAGLTYLGAASGVPYDGVSPLYGTTYQGGKSGEGAVYELSFADGVSSYNLIYDFCGRQNCLDGEGPVSPVVEDAGGNLYGNTSTGGTSRDNGVAFKLTPQGDGTWHEKVLHNFCSEANCTDGASPQSAMILDGSGNLFGTAIGGGTPGKGVVFKLQPNGHYTVQYEFCGQTDCADGANPLGSLLQGADGSLTGVTEGGGKGAGVIYRIHQNHYSVLHAFCTGSTCAEGKSPSDGVISDSSGNLYGMTQAGGTDAKGIVYEFVP